MKAIKARRITKLQLNHSNNVKSYKLTAFEKYLKRLVTGTRRAPFILTLELLAGFDSPTSPAMFFFDVGYV